MYYEVINITQIISLRESKKNDFLGTNVKNISCMLEGLVFVPYLLKHRRKTYSQMKRSVFKGLQFRVISDHH